MATLTVSATNKLHTTIFVAFLFQTKVHRVFKKIWYVIFITLWITTDTDKCYCTHKLQQTYSLKCCMQLVDTQHWCENISKYSETRI
jgi:hypothetical protein